MTRGRRRHGNRRSLPCGLRLWEEACRDCNRTTACSACQGQWKLGHEQVKTLVGWDNRCWDASLHSRGFLLVGFWFQSIESEQGEIGSIQ